MSTQLMSKKNNPNPKKAPDASTSKQQAKPQGRSRRSLPLLPIPIVAFLLLWAWIAVWQGDVFRLVRENSFFAFDSTLMDFEIGKPYGILWAIGRALLSTFRYPWLGGLILAAMLTACCWLLGYAMRLTPRWRWVQYLPLGLYTGIFTFQGISNWYEAESGQVMGIPFCILLILCVWGMIIRSFSRKPTPAFLVTPKDETPRQNRLQLYALLATLTLPMVYGHYERAYVRPIAQMQVGVYEQDWQHVIEVAHENDDLSYRPLAAMYAIALVQTGQIGDKMFDIRLDYDSLYAIGYTKPKHAGVQPTGLYQMECDYHAGLVQAAYHHAMESMAMEGPTIRNLKTLCKSSLLRSEWEVADKYLSILDKVPFEGGFVEKYRPMCGDTALINADPEMKMVRMLEPLHDAFENNFIQPVFLGYNAALMEGRSVNALWNSLMVNIYTKTMPGFLFRSQPLAGTTPPTSINEALTLMSNKEPKLKSLFPCIGMNEARLASFVNETRQYMSSPEERAKHARELFPKYKGYYPYYYFFGNLKATKKHSETKSSSNSGVN